MKKNVPIEIKLGKIKKLNPYKLMFAMDEKLRNKSIICKRCKNEIWLKQKRKISSQQFAYLIVCKFCYKEYTASAHESEENSDNIIMIINEK